MTPWTIRGPLRILMLARRLILHHQGINLVLVNFYQGLRSVLSFLLDLLTNDLTVKIYEALNGSTLTLFRVLVLKISVSSP